MLVFVYGTLRKGACNDATDFVGAEYIASAAITGAIFDLGWYPGLKLSALGNVKGDVFSVTPEQLERLDAYEGVPSLYCRRRVEATTEDLAELTVFVYEYNGNVHPADEITLGDWLEYLATEKENRNADSLL